MSSRTQYVNSVTIMAALRKNVARTSKEKPWGDKNSSLWE